VRESDSHPLKAMLEARSVAVVGASARPGSAGAQTMRQLAVGGFAGRVAPVNPKYEEIAGLRCYRSIEDVPFDIDLAILGVPNRILEQQLRSAAAASVPSAVIFASGHSSSADPPLVERLAAIVRNAGMVVCGANCMGFVNFEHKLRALAFEEPEDLEPGPITWITHSGSAFTALLHNARGLRFNLAVSAGQELTTTIADYMAYALDRESTKAIALFLEAVRDPESFRAVLELAAARDVPIVALKVGRAAAAKELVTAHSGALAGEDGAFEALFDSYGVMRVFTLNEMADTLELVAAGRRPKQGGLAAIHDSGGERAHLIDLAADRGVRFAHLSGDTVMRLESVLEPGLPAVNPLDAWGTGNEFERIFSECAHALADNDDTGALAFAVDLAGEDLEWGYADVAEQIFDEIDIPVAVLSNLSSGIDPDAARRLRAHGLPVLEDTSTGLAAFRQLFEYRDVRALPPMPAGPDIPPEIIDEWSARLSSTEPMAEVDGLAMLAEFGVQAVDTVAVSSLDDAVGAAAKLAWPVVLKATGIAHKTDVGGVRIGIATEEELVASYLEFAARFGPHLLVQAQAPAGVELAFGIVRDLQFGPLVLVALGGTLIEEIGDRCLGLPPLDEGRARRMIDRLRYRRLLDGSRGIPPVDVDSVARALARLSVLAAALGDQIEALDVNPVVAGPDGCVAVDALVVPIATGSSDT
jgi:acetate---CoA ligase (ADP-forming)